MVSSLFCLVLTFLNEEREGAVYATGVVRKGVATGLYLFKSGHHRRGRVK